MSTPSDISSRKLVTGRAPEKSSNFSQTCNLLSQYLKEKRTFGVGLTPRMEPKEDFQTSRPPAVINFLSNMENPEDRATNGQQSVGFLPQLVAGESLVKTEPPCAAQMTIFYGGKVLVFNDLPSDRAEEIMAMAGKGISFSRSAATVSDKVIEPAAAGNGSNLAGVGEQFHQQPPAKISGDLPIARRASLHRFFEKRKDRVAAKAPYQVNPQQNWTASKPDESSYRFKSDMENGNYQSSKQFDLNL